MSSRDRTLGETFYILFTTRRFTTGVPFTLAGTPVVSAYEDAGTTEITAGITLGVDHDGVTGLNLLTIVATGGNGFGTGQDYSLVITTGTIDSVSVVGEVVGAFSLGLSAAFTRLGAPAGASVSADIAVIEGQTDDIGVAGAGLTAINLPNQTMDIVGNVTGNLSGSVGSVTGAVGSVTGAVGSVTGNVGGDVQGNVDGTVAVVTTNSDMRGTDGAALASVLGALADAAATGDPTAVDTVMQYLKQLVNLLAGTAGIATMPAGADPANGVNLFEMLRGALGATFAGATDSQEAIRNRGDAAWVTAPNDPTAAAIAAAVWDALRAAHVVAGSFGQGVASVQGNVTGDVQGNVDGSTASVTGAVGSVTGNVGGNVAGDVQGNVDGSVASVTAGVLVAVGGIAATAFAANAINAAALAQDAAQEIADEILNRNLAGGGSGNTRNVRNALRAGRNRVAIVAGTATVFEEDDVTPAWTAVITTAAGNPISEVNPAGP